MRAFEGLNIALLVYSASAIFIACNCSQGLKIDRIIWFMEITFRLLSVATALYVEKSIGDENPLPLGRGEQAEGEVDDREPLNGEEVGSDEAQDQREDQRENVSLPSQTPTEQLMLQAGQSMSSEPFIQFPNREYMELPIPTSRPVYIPFLSPYGEAFCIPGSLVAQETNRDSAPNELVALHC